MSTEPTYIITEDGVTLQPGDEAYNYYDMKRGRISTDRFSSYYNQDEEVNHNRDVWFYFVHDDGTHALLNGERICTREYAARQGFPRG